MRAAGILNETSRNSIGYFPGPWLSWRVYLVCDVRNSCYRFIWSVFPPASDNDDDDDEEAVGAWSHCLVCFAYAARVLRFCGLFAVLQFLLPSSSQPPAGCVWVWPAPGPGHAPAAGQNGSALRCVLFA